MSYKPEEQTRSQEEWEISEADWDQWYKDMANDVGPLTVFDLPTEEEINQMAKAHGLDRLPF